MPLVFCFDSAVEGSGSVLASRGGKTMWESGATSKYRGCEFAIVSVVGTTLAGERSGPFVLEGFPRESDIPELLNCGVEAFPSSRYTVEKEPQTINIWQ